MLKIGVFLEGMLGREEVASAFLAMALKGVPSFRQHFFESLQIGAEQQANLSAQVWYEVAVEKDRTDVRLASPECVMLIENKVRAAAVKGGQFLQYYRHERDKPHERPIVAVYLAPGRAGNHEVAVVRNYIESPERQPRQSNDCAVHLSWETLAKVYPPPNPDPEEMMVRHGLDAIMETIRKGLGPGPFEDVPQRHEVRMLLKSAKRLALRQLSSEGLASVRLGWWPAANEIVETNHTTVGVTVKTNLPLVSSRKPIITGVLMDGQFHLPMVAAFRLTTGISKSSDLGMWWQDQTQKARVRIPGVGVFVQDRPGVFTHEFVAKGRETKAAKDIAKVIVGVIGTVEGWLKKEGLPFLKAPRSGKGKGAGEQGSEAAKKSGLR